VNSCLYRGRIAHRRTAPLEHAFSYGIGLVYLDLDELERVFEDSWLWGTERAAPVSFRRADHLGDASLPLAQCVRALVSERSGARVRGPIRLLTQPRFFGFRFNPASFYFCFAPDGRTLEQLVVEVTNTPWLERYCYVLEIDADGRAECAKRFHVSPFMGMEQAYRWQVSAPGDSLALSVQSVEHGAPCFSAALELARVPIRASSLRAAFARSPLQSLRIVAAIYTQAFRLWRRGAPFHPHPEGLRDPARATP
jgi:hypothetical protein